MFNLIAVFLGLSLTIGIGGSIYDRMTRTAVSAKRAYQFDQISYSKFTKAMTDAKPRRPSTKD